MYALVCVGWLLSIVASRAVVDLPEARTRTLRAEHFVVEELTPEGVRPVAIVALRAVAVDGGLLLERDTLFQAGGVRVLVDERHTSEPSFVWRELRTSDGLGRTWMVDQEVGGGAVRTTSHGIGTRCHGVLEGPLPVFPLALIEKLRAGEEPRSVRTLDPLAMSATELGVRVVHLEERGLRRAELTRSDGSLAGRYRFRGTVLEEFQFQDGNRRARTCDEREYRRLAAAWQRDYDPLGEVLAALRSDRIDRR